MGHMRNYVDMAKEDTEVVLLAYRQHLAGKPITDLNLDEWQSEVFNNIVQRVAAGMTGSQIAMETGYAATLCCDFRKLKQRFHRDTKNAKNYSTKTGQTAALRLKEVYGVDVAVPVQRNCPEILQMKLKGEKILFVQGISSTNVGKIRKFLKMYAEKATIPEMISELELPEKDVIKMRRIKRESGKESLVKML